MTAVLADLLINFRLRGLLRLERRLDKVGDDDKIGICGIYRIPVPSITCAAVPVRVILHDSPVPDPVALRSAIRLYADLPECGLSGRYDAAKSCFSHIRDIPAAIGLIRLSFAPLFHREHRIVNACCLHPGKFIRNRTGRLCTAYIPRFREMIIQEEFHICAAVIFRADLPGQEFVLRIINDLSVHCLPDLDRSDICHSEGSGSCFSVLRRNSPVPADRSCIRQHVIAFLLLSGKIIDRIETGKSVHGFKPVKAHRKPAFFLLKKDRTRRIFEDLREGKLLPRYHLFTGKIFFLSS